ncbi:hypothetical protein WG66_010595 [Moniliophthora roreri]|nr:hypothetical protein WG66_010595 [Moniliophthora roreri]
MGCTGALENTYGMRAEEKHGDVVPTLEETGRAHEEPHMPLQGSSRRMEYSQTSMTAASTLPTRTGPEQTLRRNAQVKRLTWRGFDVAEKSRKGRTRSSDDVTEEDIGTKRKQRDQEAPARDERPEGEKETSVVIGLHEDIWTCFPLPG